MRRALLATLAAAALLAGEARADGLRFEGDAPHFPHFYVTLDAAQKQLIAAEGAKGVKYVELRLTAAQQAAVKKESGATVPWVFAVSRDAVEGDCACGSYNLAVVIGDRLAVYNSGLGDHLSPSDVKAIEAKLRGNAQPEVAEPATGGYRKWTWIQEGQPRSPVLETLLGRFPGGRFERTLRVAKPWRAARVQVPALPRLGEESDQDFVSLFSDPARIAARPVAVDRLAWPTAAARLEEPDGTVTWLLPAVASPGVGPAARAWALFEYREGKLSAVLAVPEDGPPAGWVAE